MNTAVAAQAEQSTDLSLDTSTAALILDEGNFTRLMAMAEVMATGRSTVPKHLQGNKGDCLAVCIQAAQWKMSPFAVAQKTHLINGTLGYEAQLVIAVINTSGAIIGRLDWEWFGPWEKIVGKFKTVESRSKKDDEGKPKKYIVPDWDPKDEVGLGVRCFATVRGEKAPRVLELLMTQARTRNSTLWVEDPKQQLAYLAGKRWSRLHTPEVILGVYTPDELGVDGLQPKDMGHVEEVHDDPTVPTALLDAARAAAKKGVASYQKFWAGTGADNRKILASEHQGLKDIAVDADKTRTVDNAAATAAAPAAGAPAEPAAEATGAQSAQAGTAAAAADPETGQVDDDFVRSMNAAEKGDAK